MRILGVSLLIALPAAAGIGAARTTADDPPPITLTTTVTRTVVSSYAGVSAGRWALKFRQMRRLAYVRLKIAKRTRRALLASTSVTEAIDLAGATYGFTSTLWRKARCESHFDPYAKNPSTASGLFQFKPGTFASTPYARQSIWSPYANALAAGWMHAHGRGGEWACQ